MRFLMEMIVLRFAQPVKNKFAEVDGEEAEVVVTACTERHSVAQVGPGVIPVPGDDMGALELTALPVAALLGLALSGADIIAALAGSVEADNPAE